jgi:hypothetical protein
MRPAGQAQCIVRKDDAIALDSCDSVTLSKHVYLEVATESLVGTNQLRFGDLCATVGMDLWSQNAPVCFIRCI